MKSKPYTFAVVYGGFIQKAFFGLTRRMIASDFIRRVSETFVTRVLLIAIGLFTSVIVARTLGPEGRGLYAVAAAIGAIGVQLSNLGLSASNTYYVARDAKLLQPLLGNSLVVSFVFGGFGMILVWAIFSLWPGLAPVPELLLVLSLVWIPFGLAYLLLQQLLLGIKEVRAYNKIELSNKVLAVILVGLVILFKITTVEAVFAASLIALTISFAWALRRLRSHLRDLPHFDFSLLKENFRYGLRAYVAALFAFLVLRVDLLMVKYMLGAEQTGYYSIAVTMADMVYMLPIVVGTILFPELSAMSGNREKWQLTKKTVTLVAFVMVILAGFAALVALPVVRLLFGDQFVPAVPAFVWLMPGILMLSINTVFMNYFASMGMPLIAVYSPGVASIFNIALNTKLIPWLGIVGASTSSTLSYGLMLFASVIYISYMKARLIQ